MRSNYINSCSRIASESHLLNRKPTIEIVQICRESGLTVRGQIWLCLDRKKIYKNYCFWPLAAAALQALTVAVFTIREPHFVSSGIFEWDMGEEIRFASATDIKCTHPPPTPSMQKQIRRVHLHVAQNVLYKVIIFTLFPADITAPSSYQILKSSIYIWYMF